MPQEPKKRHSRARQGKRRASIRLAVSQGATCANCSRPVLPHQVCGKCGYYDGRQVLAVGKKSKETKSA